MFRISCRLQCQYLVGHLTCGPICPKYTIIDLRSDVVRKHTRVSVEGARRRTYCIILHFQTATAPKLKFALECTKNLLVCLSLPFFNRKFSFQISFPRLKYHLCNLTGISYEYSSVAVRSRQIKKFLAGEAIGTMMAEPVQLSFGFSV